VADTSTTRRDRLKEHPAAEVTECVICEGSLTAPTSIWTSPTPYWRGNNAEPVRSGRCCDACNYTVVLPMRLRIVEVFLSKGGVL
jgi:hypothetical protein